MKNNQQLLAVLENFGKKISDETKRTLDKTPDITSLPITREGTQMFRVRFNFNDATSDSYVVKQYTSARNGFAPDKIRRETPEHEYKLLNICSQNGARVPSAEWGEGEAGILIMTDFGNLTLESEVDRLINEVSIAQQDGKNSVIYNSAKKIAEMQIQELIARTFTTLKDLHKVTRNPKIKKQIFTIKPEIVQRKDELKNKFGEYYYILTRNAAELRNKQNFRQSPDITEIIAKTGFITSALLENSQPIQGDMSTYHVLFPQGFNSWPAFVDFGNMKARNPAVDYGFLAFAPDIMFLTTFLFGTGETVINKTLDIYEEITKQRKAEGEIGKNLQLSEVVKKENSRVLFAGLLYLLRGASKTKEWRTFSPVQARQYDAKHPLYTHHTIHQGGIRMICNYLTTSNRVQLTGAEGKTIEYLSKYLEEAVAKAQYPEIRINRVGEEETSAYKPIKTIRKPSNKSQQTLKTAIG